jgi:hypothetical protein
MPSGFDSIWWTVKNIRRYIGPYNLCMVGNEAEFMVKTSSRPECISARDRLPFVDHMWLRRRMISYYSASSLSPSSPYGADLRWNAIGIIAPWQNPLAKIVAPHRHLGVRAGFLPTSFLRPQPFVRHLPIQQLKAPGGEDKAPMPRMSERIR